MNPWEALDADLGIAWAAIKEEERQERKENRGKKGRRGKKVIDYRDFVAGVKGKR